MSTVPTATALTTILLTNNFGSNLVYMKNLIVLDYTLSASSIGSLPLT